MECLNENEWSVCVNESSEWFQSTGGFLNSEKGVSNRSTKLVRYFGYPLANPVGSYPPGLLLPKSAEFR